MGMMVAIGSQSERNIIDNQTAHLKIFNHDYWENRETLPLKYAIADPRGIIRLITEDPAVQNATERIIFPAKLSDGIEEAILSIN